MSVMRCATCWMAVFCLSGLLVSAAGCKKKSPEKTKTSPDDQPGQTNGKTKTNGMKTSGTKTNGTKTNGAKTNSAKTNAGKTGGAKTSGAKTGAAKTAGTKTGGTKTSGTKTGGTKTGKKKTTADNGASPKPPKESGSGLKRKRRRFRL